MFAHCRYCNGIREFTANQCLGCGSPKANAMVPATSLVKTNKPQCPDCRSTDTKPIDEERRVCNRCQTVFEPDDFGFCDDRQEHNAMKRERSRSHGR